MPRATKVSFSSSASTKPLWSLSIALNMSRISWSVEAGLLQRSTNRTNSSKSISPLPTSTTINNSPHQLLDNCRYKCSYIFPNIHNYLTIKYAFHRYALIWQLGHIHFNSHATVLPCFCTASCSFFVRIRHCSCIIIIIIIIIIITTTTTTTIIIIYKNGAFFWNILGRTPPMTRTEAGSPGLRIHRLSHWTTTATLTTDYTRL